MPATTLAPPARWADVRPGDVGSPEVFAQLMAMPPSLVRKHIRQQRFAAGVVMNLGGSGRNARYRLDLLRAQRAYAVTAR